MKNKQIHKESQKKRVLLAVNGLKEAFEFHEDPARSVHMAAYMKNRFRFLGLSQPARKALSKPFLKEWATWDIAVVLEISSALWQLPQREYQYVAMDLLHRCKKSWTPGACELFKTFITDKSWWDTVDFIAARLIGGFLENKDRAFLTDWVISENIWQNRTALLFQLFYKEKTDQAFLFNTIETLMPKPEFFIQKAIGWSLRQYHKTKPTAVEEFVEQHNLSGLARREALKHVL